MLKVVVERPHACERRVIKLASAIKLVHNNGNTANVIQIDKRTRARRLQFHQMRRARRHLVPVVHRYRATRLARDGR